MKRINFLIILALVLSLASPLAAAEYNMKLGWAETADPMGHPCSAAMAVFKDYVENLTKGRLEVKLYPAGQLGDAKSMLGQVKKGILQSCASVPSGMIAGRYYKNMNIFDIPYLFDNVTVAWNVLNPSTLFFREFTEDMAAETGLRPLAFFIEGQRHFTNNKVDIKTVQDLKGLKIRTMEVPAHMEMVKAFGASPIPISWLELYSSLQTGVIDGQENPVGNILYAKLYEVQKYLTFDGHVTLLNTWIVNEKWYQKLPADIKAAIQEAAQLAEITNRGLSQIREFVGVDELKKKGMTVTILGSDELAEFQKVAQEKVVPYVTTTVDDAKWIDRIQQEVEKARKAFAAE